jgi:hypothetical protein
LTVAASGPTCLYPDVPSPTVGAELARDGGLIADQSLSGVHIQFCGNGGWRFRPYGEALFSNAKKVPKKARPKRPAPRLGSAFLRSGIHPGHRLRLASLQPPLDVFDFVERRCAPTPQMNTSTQPPEGAGGSRSRDAGELTLGLLSGEKRKAYAAPLWERACSRRRPDSRPVYILMSPVQLWESAREGDVSSSIDFS